MNIDSGKKDFKFIEITEPNSIIYIGFALLDYDINFKLQKYNIDSKDKADSYENEDEDNNTFKTILCEEKINACNIPAKIVIFVPEPGIYKAIWDNTYSWMNGKKLRIRVSVLKALDNIIDNISNDNNSTEKVQQITCHSNEKQINNANESSINNLNQNKSNIDIRTNTYTRTSIDKRFPLEDFSSLKLRYKDSKKTTLYFPINNSNNKTNYEINLLFDKDSFIHYNATSSSYTKYPKTEDSLNSIVTELLNTIENEKVHSSNILNINLYNIEKDSSNYNIYELNLEEEFNKIISVYPKSIINKITDKKLNCKFYNKSFCESLLFNALYNQFKQRNKSNSVDINNFEDESKLHTPILFIAIVENQTPVIYLYQSEQIYDNLKGLNFDTKKPVYENEANINNFINKSQMLFGEFNVNIAILDFSNSNNTENDSKYKAMVDNIKENCDIKEGFSVSVLNNTEIKFDLEKLKEIGVVHN